MLALLLALQVSSTHCLPDYGAGISCTTTTPPRIEMPPPDYDNDSGTVLGTALGDLIRGTGDRHVRSRLGKMLAAGDCDGALRYALKKGRFDLAGVVKDLCAANVISEQESTHSRQSYSPTVRRP